MGGQTKRTIRKEQPKKGDGGRRLTNPSASQVLRALRATVPETRRLTKEQRVMPLARAREGSTSDARSHVTGPTLLSSSNTNIKAEGGK